jgi:enoyl-CoA hydratase
MATVVLEHPEPHITLVTLNRPERLNAMNYELVASLHDALDQIGQDPECRVAILTGAGRGFCSGLDLKDWGRAPAPGGHPHALVGTGGQEFIASLTLRVRATPQVILAAVNGPAFGGGLALACAADLRVAAESARFCSAFIRTGLTGTDIGISHTLPRIVGAGRAFDLIVTGRELGAVEGERIGLVNRVVPDDALASEAAAVARQIAGYAPSSLVLTKEAFWHNVDTPSLAAAIALENRNQALASRTPEVEAFMAGYSARFS